MRLISTLLALLIIALVGAGGCGGQSTAEAKKKLEELKKKEKPKEPFDHLRVFTEPNERAFMPPKDDDNQPIVQKAIKPGHWTGVLVEAKTNNFDFSGELVSEPRDNQQRLVELEGSPFALVMSRPAVLPKGQKKTLEAIFFSAPLERNALSAMPPDPTIGYVASRADRRTSTWIYNQLRSPASGIDSRVETELLPHMPSFQYYMVVLAREPSRYRFLKVLDSVRPAGELAPLVPEDGFYYRVVFPQPVQPLALPSQPLCWTSVAYVVWDDVLPTLLTPQQQQAMLDWLHWGGGLVLSGPQTLDALRGTFLEPYLPAAAAETTRLDAASLAELNAHWTVPNLQGQRQPMQLVEPWSGIKLAKDPAADFLIGTGELVVERRVGRGRIVATAFRLNEQDLINWRSFDSFFNACILGHPRRSFDAATGRFQFAGRRAYSRFDPELTSKVRFFSRDSREPSDAPTGLAAQAAQPAPFSAGMFTAGAVSTPAVSTPASDDVLSEADQFDAFKARSGVAAWNDFSRVSATAGQALRDAAGISVPKREFVLWMVGIYLVLIVPVNWLVFRLVGRVEWAWFAVPVFAIGWAAIVIWLAQLDIGFARAQTEVAVLEVQRGFARAHLTRYTALYTSLSTSYNVHFDEPTAVAQPFAVDVRLLQGQARSAVTWRNVGENQLTDFMVSSNSTGMVHSEQMFDLGGSLDWQSTPDEPGSLANNSKLKLSGVVVLRRRSGAANETIFESAWLGELPPGKTIDVHFLPHDAAALADERDKSPLSAKDHAEGGLSLRHLLDFAGDARSLEVGDVRLVAWHDAPLAGVRIEPAAAQARRATLVVANLEFGQGETPQPDMNLRIAAESVGDDASPAGGSPRK